MRGLRPVVPRLRGRRRRHQARLWARVERESGGGALVPGCLGMPRRAARPKRNVRRGHGRAALRCLRQRLGAHRLRSVRRLHRVRGIHRRCVGDDRRARPLRRGTDCGLPCLVSGCGEPAGYDHPSLRQAGVHVRHHSGSRLFLRMAGTFLLAHRRAANCVSTHRLRLWLFFERLRQPRYRVFLSDDRGVPHAGDSMRRSAGLSLRQSVAGDWHPGEVLQDVLHLGLRDVPFPLDHDSRRVLLPPARAGWG